MTVAHVIEPSAWTAERETLLRKLWDEGLSASQISLALACGMTRNAVIGKVRRMNLSRRAPSWTKFTREERLLRNLELKAQALERQARRRAAQRGKAVARREPVALIWAGSLNLTLLELERGQCHFPFGDGPTYLFCGQPVQKGSSYCPHCFLVSRRRPSEVQPKLHFVQHGWAA